MHQPPQDPTAFADVLTAAFPAALADEAKGALEVMPHVRLAPVAPFDVEVQGETVTIPSRIYHDEPDAELQASLTATQQLILHCLYSRHCDGRVRQRHLERIVASDEPWVVPFVVQLAGEYVVEILAAITRGLPGLAISGSAQRRLYGEFIVRNPAFFARTERRLVSYWTCYYRWMHEAFATYPGAVLVDELRAAATEQAGRPCPRQTPRS
ncbi:hypothetical protein [Streptomyces sp. KL116D]|uniref:hypothetical protein n=1 Tax=Streptomyces sp. KL116D TaxID=3045152 RepID=UPI003556C853